MMPSVSVFARCAALLVALGGCAFSPPTSPEDREALQSCRADADRAYNAQNRAQLSEQDSQNTPFSANAMPNGSSQGLSDKYAHDEMVADCLHHGASVPVNPQPKP